MARQFTLGKKERLKSRKSIEQLFNEGKKINLVPYRIFYTLSPLADERVLLFGVGVSAKNFKRAVDRNRIKRLIREAYRLQKLSLLDKLKDGNLQLNVFFIYTGKELPEYKDVYQKIGMVLNKMEKIVSG
ncbi:MAG: ribonuclease P protein component [Chitinophagaceae bacterium]|nr:ribonuclease P protein component [Chitinophagaceae bacterium]